MSSFKKEGRIFLAFEKDRSMNRKGNVTKSRNLDFSAH